MRHLALVSLLVACGPGRPAIREDKLLVDLTLQERDELCEYKAAVEDGPRKVWCADDYYVDIQGLDQCKARFANFPTDCPATVGEAESCWEAIADDACDGAVSDACTGVNGCL